METDETVDNDQTQEEGQDLNEEQEGSSDPLDSIEDIEELRKKAKGYRSERNRYKNKPKAESDSGDEPQEDETPGEYLSKKDFYKANERKAINQLTLVSDDDPDDVKARKEYIRDNLDSIQQFYSPWSGKDTPEDIYTDLKRAVTIFESENPPQQDDGSTELSETAGTGTSSKQPTKQEKKEDPRFRTPPQPDEWYSLTPEQEKRLKDKGVLD